MSIPNRNSHLFKRPLRQYGIYVAALKSHPELYAKSFGAHKKTDLYRLVDYPPNFYAAKSHISTYQALHPASTPYSGFNNFRITDSIRPGGNGGLPYIAPDDKDFVNAREKSADLKSRCVSEVLDDETVISFSCIVGADAIPEKTRWHFARKLDSNLRISSTYGPVLRYSYL